MSAVHTTQPKEQFIRRQYDLGACEPVFKCLKGTRPDLEQDLRIWIEALYEIVDHGLRSAEKSLNSGMLTDDESRVLKALIDIVSQNELKIGILPEPGIQAYMLSNPNQIEICVSIGVTKLEADAVAYVLFHELAHAVYPEIAKQGDERWIQAHKREYFCDLSASLVLRVSGFLPPETDFPEIPQSEILPSILSTHPSNHQRVIALTQIRVPPEDPSLADYLRRKVSSLPELHVPNIHDFFEGHATTDYPWLTHLKGLFNRFSILIKEQIKPSDLSPGLDEHTFNDGHTFNLELALSDYNFSDTIRFFNLQDLYQEFRDVHLNGLKGAFESYGGHFGLKYVGESDPLFERFCQAVFLTKLQRKIKNTLDTTPLQESLTTLLTQTEIPHQIAILAPWGMYPFFIEFVWPVYNKVVLGKLRDLIEGYRQRKLDISEFVSAWKKLAVSMCKPVVSARERQSSQASRYLSDVEILDLVKHAEQTNDVLLVSLLKDVVGEHEIYRSTCLLSLAERVKYAKFVARILNQQIPNYVLTQGASLEELFSIRQLVSPEEYCIAFYSAVYLSTDLRLNSFFSSLREDKITELLEYLNYASKPRRHLLCRDLVKLFAILSESANSEDIRYALTVFGKLYNYFCRRLTGDIDREKLEKNIEQHGEITVEEVLRAREFLYGYKNLLSYFDEDAFWFSEIFEKSIREIFRGGDWYGITFGPFSNETPLKLVFVRIHPGDSRQNTHLNSNEETVSRLFTLLSLRQFSSPYGFVIKVSKEPLSLVPGVNLSEQQLSELKTMFQRRPWLRIWVSSSAYSVLPFLLELQNKCSDVRSSRDLLMSTKEVTQWIIFDSGTESYYEFVSRINPHFFLSRYSLKDILEVVALDFRPDLKEELFNLSPSDLGELLKEAWPEPSFSRDLILYQYLANQKSFDDDALRELFDMFQTPTRCSEYVFKYLEEKSSELPVDDLIEIISKFFIDEDDRAMMVRRLLKDRIFTVEQARRLANLGRTFTEPSDQDVIISAMEDMVSKLPIGDKVEMFRWLIGLRSNKPQSVEKIESSLRVDLTSLPDLFRSSAGFREKTLVALTLGRGGLLEPYNFESLKNILIEFIEKLDSEGSTGQTSNKNQLREILIRVLPLLFKPSQVLHKYEILKGILDNVYRDDQGGDAEKCERVVAAILNAFGPLGIKIGQLLYHQPLVRDLFPALIDTLRGFTGQAEMSLLEALDLITRLRHELNLGDDDELKVIGAASIKVVFKVKKPNGETRVIKVSRASYIPEAWEGYLKELSDAIDQELASSGYRIPEDFNHFLVRIIRHEMNLNHEQGNYETLSKALRGVRIPEVYKCGTYFVEEEYVPHTDDYILTRHKLRLLEHVLSGISQGSPFHYDLHAGNVGVMDGNLIAYDTGSVVQLSREDVRFLRKILFSAVSHRFLKGFLNQLFNQGFLEKSRVKVYEERIRSCKSFRDRLVVTLDLVFEAQLKGYKIPNAVFTTLLAIGKSMWLFEGIKADDIFRYLNEKLKDEVKRYRTRLLRQ